MQIHYDKDSKPNVPEACESKKIDLCQCKFAIVGDSKPNVVEACELRKPDSRQCKYATMETLS